MLNPIAIGIKRSNVILINVAQIVHNDQKSLCSHVFYELVLGLTNIAETY